MHTPVFRLATAAALSLAAMGMNSAIAAGLFNQQETDQNRFAVVASPYAGGTAHQLLIIEQLANSRACWSETGGSPTQINPLLMEFDFTDICGRSIDSNGYSIRTAGEDLGWRYSLRVVRRNNDLLLLGVPAVDRSAPELLIGRTRGATDGFAKFSLEPGWRLTKRVYNGSPVGHVYLTNDQTLASLNSVILATRPAPQPVISQPSPTATAPVVTRPAAATRPSTTTRPRRTFPPTWRTSTTQQPAVAGTQSSVSPPAVSQPSVAGTQSSIPIPVPPPETSLVKPVSTPVFQPGANDFIVPTVSISR